MAEYEPTYTDEAWFWEAYELGQAMVATDLDDKYPIRIRVDNGDGDDENSYAEAYLSIDSAERLAADLQAKIVKAKEAARKLHPVK